MPADWLSAALAKFRDQRPEVEVEVTGGIGTALADLVRQGALDILVSAQCGTSGGANYSSRPIA